MNFTNLSLVTKLSSMYIFILYSQTMKLVLERRQEEAMKRAAREKEISKVKVNQQDIDLIVSS